MKITALVIKEGLTVEFPNLLLTLIASVSIYVMIVPTILMDIFLWQYQLIYFGITKIPKIDRSKYVVVDRFNFSKLNSFQKLNCVYCGYVNGVASFAKDVAAQTEIYSCAVKHKTQPYGQNHQEDFYPASKFE